MAIFCLIFLYVLSHFWRWVLFLHPLRHFILVTIWFTGGFWGMVELAGSCTSFAGCGGCGVGVWRFWRSWALCRILAFLTLITLIEISDTARSIS